jgi:lipid-binding SYLF domain-containing protein
MFAHRLRRSAVVAGLMLAVASCASGPAEQSTPDLVNRAQTTVQNFANDPNMTWFRDHVGDAKAIMIVPTVVRAGFIFGGSGGDGVVLARGTERTSWSYPAFYGIGAVSFGLQIGGEVAEVVLLFMTDRGLDRLMSNSFRLGADISVAAGPVGAGAGVATADVLAFSRSQGVYGGLTVEGSIINVRTALNDGYYSREVRPIQILVQREVSNPQADPLRTTVANIGGN